jgi:hypothetical protein
MTISDSTLLRLYRNRQQRERRATNYKIPGYKEEQNKREREKRKNRNYLKEPSRSSYYRKLKRLGFSRQEILKAILIEKERKES